MCVCVWLRCLHTSEDEIGRIAICKRFLFFLFLFLVLILNLAALRCLSVTDELATKEFTGRYLYGDSCTVVLEKGWGTYIREG